MFPRIFEFVMFYRISVLLPIFEALVTFSSLPAWMNWRISGQIEEDMMAAFNFNANNYTNWTSSYLLLFTCLPWTVECKEISHVSLGLAWPLCLINIDTDWTIRGQGCLMDRLDPSPLLWDIFYALVQFEFIARLKSILWMGPANGNYLHKENIRQLLAPPPLSFLSSSM